MIFRRSDDRCARLENVEVECLHMRHMAANSVHLGEHMHIYYTCTLTDTHTHTHTHILKLPQIQL